MAARFWVGGTGTWDDTATSHWASSSGGSSGASAPTSSDAVTFDSNSGTAATVTVASTARCQGCTLNKSDLTLSHNATNGSWIGGGQTFTMTAGTWLTNSNSVNVGRVIATGSGTRTITLGSSTINLTGTGTATVWNLSGTNITFSGASATLNLSSTDGSVKTFTGGGRTYGTLKFVMTGANDLDLDITDSNTFGTLDLECSGTGHGNVALADGGTQTTTSVLKLIGNATHALIIGSETGTASTVKAQPAVTITRTLLSYNAPSDMIFNIQATATTRSITITGAASGVRTRYGTAAMALALAGAASGVRTTFGTANRSIVLTGAASGVRATYGTASRAITITGAAAGVRTTYGTAAQSIVITGSASGVRTTFGSADRSIVITGTASGVRTAYGEAAMALTLTGAASGVRTTFGAATLALTITMTARAVGALFPPGDAGTLTESATGQITESRRGRITHAREGGIAA